jgi:glycosyltransferase involved in cell wall biosynthesis
MVSVRLMTYNHENYISTAMEGILNQKADFNIEIVVGDDFSTDKTLEIIKKFKNTENIKIRILDRPVGGDYWQKRKEKGRLYNFINILDNCRGKYIALLDGDDYWTDSLKLQKQVDFLETNENVNLVHTDIDWLNVKDGTIIKNYYKSINYEIKRFYDLKQYLLKPKARTLTICFRRQCLNGFHEIIDPNWTVGDTPLLLYVVKDKKIGFINESTGVYRRGIDTASSNETAIRQFNYWKNASSKVKYFFYNYYKMNDKEVKNKLEDDYYDGMFQVSVRAKKYPYILKSLFYKLFHLKLRKSHLGLLYSALILNKK